jgi:L,D-peptidoglycan transpeptidase YkuD (ErfK/YbiS/YcfS/YnhG family)
MAVFVFTDAFLTVNTINLSAYVTSISVNYEKDSVEVTAMGATGHVMTGGLQNLSVTVELNNDQAAATVLETLYSAVGSGSNTLVIKNATSGSPLPVFTCSNMFLAASTPVNGAVGELSKQSVTFTGGSIVKS